MDSTQPSTLRAGDSIRWYRDLPDYPASAGWALRYRMLFPSGDPVEIETTGEGDRFQVDLSSEATGRFIAGKATLVAWVERDAERVTIDGQQIVILPDLTRVGEFDGRSENARALAQAKAALADYVASGRAHVQRYTIASREFWFRDVKDIKALIDHYEAEVAKEAAALAILSGGSPGRVCVRM